jgi:hypothetical protein
MWVVLCAMHIIIHDVSLNGLIFQEHEYEHHM